MSQPFLSGWEGRSPDELIALAGTHRVDSIVLAFEEAIGMKSYKHGAAALSELEADVLAIEGLEREVNNGGYGQFFTNTTVEFVPRIIGALERIDCRVTSELTQRALRVVLADTVATVDAVTARMAEPDDARDELLNEIAQAYYTSGEDIADALFRCIQRGRTEISFG